MLVKIIAEIKNEIQYIRAVNRVEELLQVVGNETSTEDQNFVELDLLSDLVAEYEERYYPLQKLNIVADIILIRKYKYLIQDKILLKRFLFQF